MLTLVLAAVLYVAAAVILSAVRRSISEREAFEMAIVRQIKAHYEFNKRFAKQGS
jgi:hypothetical protein